MLPRPLSQFLGTIALLAVSIVLASPSHAQTAAMPEVATTWPGISYRITQVQKIPGNRLLVVVCVHALRNAAPGGTLIGIPVPIPPGTPPAVIATGQFLPKPFSIEAATMTDDRTHQVYNTVKPDGSGPHYVPATLITTLHPGQGDYMTIQFPYPPPAPAEPGAVPVPPKVTLLIPNAVGPLKGLILP